MLYRLVVGLLIGFVVIRVDLLLTGSPAAGRRARTDDRADAAPRAAAAPSRCSEATRR